VLAVARWPILALVMVCALAAMYRSLPNRNDPRWRWVSWGAAIATVLWVIASAGFAVYSSRFGNYDRTYGSMAAVVVTMLWLFIHLLRAPRGPRHERAGAGARRQAVTVSSWRDPSAVVGGWRSRSSGSRSQQTSLDMPSGSTKWTVTREP
jgi:hypothetical protein